MDKSPEQVVREALDAGSPKAWIWDEDGDTCVGTVVSGFIGPTKYGDCKVMVLNVEGEMRSVWLNSTALENQVLRQKPLAGDVIGIRRGEKRTSSVSGNEYWDFTAYKHGAAGGSLNWGEEVAALNSGEPEGQTAAAYTNEPPMSREYVQDAEVVEEPASQAPDGW